MDAFVRAERVGAESGTAMALWIALVAALSVGGSLALACAAPLAGIAAFAGTRMRVPEGLALVLATWLANQLVGYLVLDYPQSWDSFAWGGAIGLAAVLAFALARAAANASTPALAQALIAFAAAFAAYEGGLLAATAVLPSSQGAFALQVIGRILAINGVAFASLLFLHRAAVALSFSRPYRLRVPSRA